MSFLSPLTALAAAAITVPLLVSLYFLKLRRKPMAVPSTLLWKRAVQDLQVNAPFQRIRNNLLLWLQLLLLALLLLALARPVQRATLAPGERVVIVIDRSASMNTRDAAGGASRLEEAKQKALELIEAIDAGDSASGAMVVTFAQRAQVVQSFTNDRGLLRSAVRGVTPTDQRGRLEPALGLIAPHAAGPGAAADADALTVYVFSDGRVHRDTGEALALPGATLAFERLGEPTTANLGFVAASARRDYNRPGRVGIFARLAHTGSAPVRANVNLRVDGRVVRTRAVSLPAATADQPGQESLTFDLDLPGGASIELTHDQQDTLAADDAARLELLPAQRLRVMLVTEGNRYLRQAVLAAGARDLVLKTPAEYEGIAPQTLRDGGGGEPGYDLVVFDRYRPASVPTVSSLSFGSAPPVDGFDVFASSGDAPAMQSVLTWKRDHPLMRYVVLDDVTLRRPGRLSVPLSARVLAVGLAGPLIAEVRVAGRTHAAVSFDVLESRWPHHWSFQVFMVNALEVLGLRASPAGGGGAEGRGGAAAGAGLMFATGASATVPVAQGVSTVGYRGPERLSGTARSGSASLPAFERVGVYQADAGEVLPPFERLPVNLLDVLESDIRPAARLEVSTGVAQTAGASSLIRKEVWTWFAWGALGLLLVEWWVYARRMRV
ncbi:MAG: VWA domain-containing protein [Planctomycetota bacterium]